MRTKRGIRPHHIIRLFLPSVYIDGGSGGFFFTYFCIIAFD